VARPASNREITPPAEKKFSGTVKEVKQQRCVICNCIEFDVAREELAKLRAEAGTNLEAVLEGGDVARAVRRATEENHAIRQKRGGPAMLWV